MSLTLVFGAENYEIVSVVRSVVCLCQRKSVRMVMLLHGGFVGISTIFSVGRCTTKGPRQKNWKLSTVPFRKIEREDIEIYREIFKVIEKYQKFLRNFVTHISVSLSCVKKKKQHRWKVQRARLFHLSPHTSTNAEKRKRLRLVLCFWK